MTDSAQTDDGKDRGEDQPLVLSTSKAMTKPQHTGLSVKHPANHLQSVLKNNKMVRVSPNYEDNGAAKGSAQFAEHTNRAKTSAAVWHLAKPRVFGKISHKEKLMKRYTKSNLIFD
jgi:hypothetical protein